MGDLVSHPASPGVDPRIGQIDAVTGPCQLVAGLGLYLHRQSGGVQPGIAPEAAGAAGQSDAGAVGVVDSVSLRAGQDLYRSSSICFCER